MPRSSAAAAAAATSAAVLILQVLLLQQLVGQQLPMLQLLQPELSEGRVHPRIGFGWVALAWVELGIVMGSTGWVGLSSCGFCWIFLRLVSRQSLVNKFMKFIICAYVGTNNRIKNEGLFVL